MAERSVSIFLLDTYKRWFPETLEIEEYRAFTELHSDTVPDSVLMEEAIKQLNQELKNTASDDYRSAIMYGLLYGSEDFRLPLGVNAETHVVVVRNTPATSYLVVARSNVDPGLISL